MITPGLLTDLCRAELADSIRAQGDGRRESSSREQCGGKALCSFLFNGVILLKVMTQPYRDFHSAFRCSYRKNMLMNRFSLFNIAELLVESPLIC